MEIALILGAATSFLKIHNRGDQITALRTAVSSDIAAVLPSITIPFDFYEFYDGFVPLYKADKANLPKDLQSALEILYKAYGDSYKDQEIEDEHWQLGDTLKKYVTHYFPNKVINSNFSPHEAYFKYLEENYPNLYRDKDFRVAALMLNSGKDTLPPLHKALSLAVVDVLAEFGSNYVSSFISHEGTQKLVGSILKRVDQLDLDQKTDADASKIAKLFLSATLNGALDERGFFKTDNKWFSALLDAIVKAREDAEDKVEFIEGLLRGKGYPQLVAALLGETSELLTEGISKNYQAATKHFIESLADIIKKNGDFKSFLNDSWSDIALAGFKSVAEHGETIVGDSELLGKVLVAVTEKVSSDPKYFRLTKANIYDLTSAALSAVAENPDLIDDDGDTGDWLAALAESVADTLQLASDGTVKKLFSSEGLQALVSQGLKSIAKRPTLMDSDSEKVTALTQGIIKSLSELDAPELTNAQSIASATLGGALNAVEENPALLTSSYPKLTASLAKNMGKLVADKEFTAISASEILKTATHSIAKNPQVFEELSGKLAAQVIKAIKQAQQDAGESLAKGISIAKLVGPVLDALARYGKDNIGDNAEAFVTALTDVVKQGLLHADKQLGINANLADTPAIVAHHVSGMLQGDDAA